MFRPWKWIGNKDKRGKTGLDFVRTHTRRMAGLLRLVLAIKVEAGHFTRNSAKMGISPFHTQMNQW